MWGFIFRLNEIFRIAYAYAYISAIDYKTRENRFKIIMLDNND